MNQNTTTASDVISNAPGVAIPSGQGPVSQPEKKPLREFTLAEGVFAWFCILAGYLFCRAFPVSSNPLGCFGFTILIFAFTSVTLIILKKRIPVIAVVAALSAIAVSATFVLSSNGFLRIAAYPYVLATYCYFVYSATGNSLKRGFCDLIVIDYIVSIFVMPFYAIVQIFRAMFKGKMSLNGKLVLKIVVGASCAVIPASLVWLLLSYDSGFVELFNKIFDFKTSDIASHLGSFILGVPIGMYIFGLYASSTVNNRERVVTAELCSKASASMKIAPVASVVSAFVPLLCIYAIFFVSQWKYYVSAFTGVLPADISYAEYAREGFFQLFAVSCINLVLIVLATLFSRRRQDNMSWAFRVLSVVISFFTLTLIATAAAKMIMYIDAYGLTQMRVYASWAMAVLALIFVFVALRAFIPKMNLGVISLAACVVCFIALGVSDVDGMIADYNVDAYLDGRLETVDTYSIASLGDSGIPALVHLYDEMLERFENETLDSYGAEKFKWLEKYLEKKKKSYENDSRGFFSMTLPAFKARRIMSEVEIKEFAITVD